MNGTWARRLAYVVLAAVVGLSSCNAMIARNSDPAPEIVE